MANTEMTQATVWTTAGPAEPLGASLRPTIWLTGLSGAGKTTIATALAAHLRSDAERVEILDGAAVREELGDFFGYSRDERLKVNRVLCAMAKLLARNGIVPVVTAITPYQEGRDFNRRELGGAYLEIYVDCPVEVCVARDRTLLYAKALRGDMKHVIGVDDVYEVPRRYDLKVTTATETPEESIARVAGFVSAALKGAAIS